MTKVFKKPHALKKTGASPTVNMSGVVKGNAGASQLCCIWCWNDFTKSVALELGSKKHLLERTKLYLSKTENDCQNLMKIQ
jgi:hypothetical protein